MNKRIFKKFEDVFQGTADTEAWWQSKAWFSAFCRFVHYNGNSMRYLRSENGAFLPITRAEKKWPFGLKSYELRALTNYFSPYFQLSGVSDNTDKDEHSGKSGYLGTLKPVKRYLSKCSTLTFEPMVAEQANSIREALEALGFFVASHQSSANWYEDNIQSVDDYWSKRPSKIKNTIRRKRKKLVNNNDFQLVVHNGDDVIKSLADFHKVYQQSWKVNEVYPAFIDEIARQFHSSDKLRMGFVYHGGKPVAAQLWFVERGVASIFKLAHVPEFEQQSVGSVLTAEMFNWVIAHDEVKKVDFLTGNDVYKKDWMSNSQPLYTVTAFNKKTAWGFIGMCKSMLDKDQH